MHVTMLLTFVAMVAFATNSLLARAALIGNAIDALNFTMIRLASGALALMSLAIYQQHRRRVARDEGSVAELGRRGHVVQLLGKVNQQWQVLPGNWPSSLALFAYALAFSLAYLRLGAATGALILFSAVQGTMIFWGVMQRDRPTFRQTVGLAIAYTAFVYLLLPGLGTPDFLGSLLMVFSGVAWAIYSLRGRGARDPLGETTGHFVRSALLCSPLVPLAVFSGHTTTFGIGLAVISGVVTSGFGYAVWYRALPGLSTTQAAAVQLTVPILAAIGAVVFLSEAPTVRLLLESTFILGGVTIVVLSRTPTKIN